MKRSTAWATRMMFSLACLGWVFCAQFSSNGAFGSVETERPVITDILFEDGALVVNAEVPAGALRATLEYQDRIGEGPWMPMAVEHLDGTVTSVQFRVSLEGRSPAAVLRVSVSFEEVLPASFFNGDTDYEGVEGQEGMVPTAGPGRDNDYSDGGAVPEGGDREVVESDIWRVHGDLVYFFNQNRGLQVIDVENPDEPAIASALSAPAMGEQMYVLPSGEAVLLTRGGTCSWYSMDSESEILIADVSSLEAEIIGRAPVKGWIQESRLVGSVLYVATSVYRQVEVIEEIEPDDNRDPDGTTEPSVVVSYQWENGTVLTAIDLADPANPVVADELWFAGSGNVVQATNRFFFIAIYEPGNWYSMRVEIVDITDPNGAMSVHGSVRAAGRVQDKFKMSLDGSIFTVISEAWDQERRWMTTLETFDLDSPILGGPSFPVYPRVGVLRLAEGEQLHATRFDGKRVYIVTFERVDPLWVVSLEDPAAPAIVGELEVPGWSTYIQPLGDRLVSVGIDNEDGWKVAVSLFDVSNPEEPTLIRRVSLGDQHSWSEATFDEKAFSVLPEDGLILIPYQGWDGTDYVNRVQLIDLELYPGELAVRGVIEHDMPARRSTVHRERIISISSVELLSVDATDRDNPLVTGSLPLSWPADRVLLVDEEHVLAFERGDYGWSGHSARPRIHVLPQADPDLILATLPLDGPPIAGAHLAGNLLYLIQAPLDQRWVEVNGEWKVEPTTVVFSVWNIAALPDVALLGLAKVESTVFGWGLWADFFPLESDERDVLVTGFSGGYWYGPWIDVAGPVRDMAMPYWGGGGYGQLLAWDVTDPGNPELLSEIRLDDRVADIWWSTFSDFFQHENRIYTSHSVSGYVEPDPEDENPDTSGRWVTRYYLDVIDYSDPAAPEYWDPVEIDGSLIGLSHAGQMLYTRGEKWDEKGNYQEYLTAAAFDGAGAHFLDRMALPATWPHPIEISSEGTVFLGYVPQGEEVDPVVESYRISNEGIFERIASDSQPQPAQNIVNTGSMLVVVSQGNQFRFYTPDAALPLLGEGQMTSCVWANPEYGVGDPARGFWLPLGIYGVMPIPVLLP